MIFVVVEPTSIPMSNCFIYLIFRDSDLSGLHRQKEKGHKPVSYLDLRRFLHDAGDFSAGFFKSQGNRCEGSVKNVLRSDWLQAH